MKTLHWYLIRQILATLLMTITVFTFVLMMVSVLKEVLGLLVNRQVGLAAVAQAVGLLIPYVMIFALPMGMLTAALLVFGRFSADNELTAVRASGVSLVAIITPVLLLSVALSGVAALINMQLAPRCRIAYKELLFQVGMAKTGSFIPEKTYIKDISTNAIVYVSKVRGTNLEDVMIYQFRDDKIESYTRAESATIHVNPSNNLLAVTLYNETSVFFRDGRRLPQTSSMEMVELLYTNVLTRPRARKVDLSDMTFLQLRDELRELEKGLNAATPVYGLSSEELRQRMRQSSAQRRDLTTPIRVQMHRQVSFSFACLGFTLVGIPLGLRAHRRETTFGIAVALILVVIYYSFLILGQSLETRPDFMPHLILWVPNFLFQAVGMVMLWRANRGV